MICIHLKKVYSSEGSMIKNKFPTMDSSYMDILKTLFELFNGQGCVFKYVLLVIRCSLLKINFNIILHFILDLVKSTNQHNLERKMLKLK